MMRMRRPLWVALLFVLPGEAQAQRAVTVRADNDAFNFWQLPWARPDEEYTSGVRLTSQYAGAAPWARRLEHALGGCRGASAPCSSHTYAIGQDIYTAVRAADAPVAEPGGRPDAGVLWLAATTRVERQSALTELGWTVGVTGKPSLAQSMQQLFHDMAPSFNRPIAWGEQVPAEPVFAASLDTRRLAHAGVLEIQSHGGASLGTLLTEARAGVALRLGTHLMHPWMLESSGNALHLTIEGDATARAVARNEVLNGAFFRHSVRVTPRPLVTELQGGLRVRWRMFEGAWMAHQTSAEYVTRRTPHVWSTLEASWFPRR